MSVSIVLEQTNTVEEGATPDAPVYQVKNEITAADGISMALFVFKTDDDAFSHVATPRDLELYSADKATAILAGDLYYRAPLATLRYADVYSADEFASLVRVRLQYTVNSWPTVQEDFQGTTLYTITTAT